ncbi:MAG: hypothetical protein AAGG07_08535 [Planctomycetota bacterium]
MYRSITTTLAVAAFAGSALADFETDFGVGRTMDGNLIVEFNFDNIEEIQESPDLMAFDGFFSDEPGFAGFDFDEPDEGIFALEAGAQIQFELVSADAGFRVYDPTFSTVLNPGDTFNFDAVTSTSTFDDHPWWTIERSDPGFDESIFSYDVTFRLLDVGSTGYGATDNITVTFTRVPTPASAAVLGLAGLAATRRRR